MYRRLLCLVSTLAVAGGCVPAAQNDLVVTVKRVYVPDPNAGNLQERSPLGIDVLLQCLPLSAPRVETNHRDAPAREGSVMETQRLLDLCAELANKFAVTAPEHDRLATKRGEIAHALPDYGLQS